MTTSAPTAHADATGRREGAGRRLAFTRDWRDVGTTAAATILLAAFWWLAVTAAIERSPTSDEAPHIGSGYAYNRFGDFRMQPENGNLPQRLLALPGMLDGARFPTDREEWTKGQYWMLAWDYFYGLNNPTDWIVFSARALNAVFGVAFGWLTFAVARAWFGRAGGLIALGLFVFSPNLLAHSAVATSDVLAALLLLLAPWCFWWHLRRRDLTSALVAGAASGLALVAKFNGVLLAPMFIALIAADVWLRGEPGARGRRSVRDAGMAVGQAVMAAGVIWAFYDFRFQAAADPQLPFAWSLPDMLAAIGWKRAVIEHLLEWKLLPKAWLYGFTHVLAGAEVRPAFFAGEYSDRGWWTFFPAVFLAKTSLAALGALILAFVATAVATLRAAPAVRRRWADRVMPLVVAPGIIWLAAMASNLNIGDRHIIGVYPPLFIFAGILGTQPWLRWLAAALVVAHAHASFAIRPFYLAAFNPLAGGPLHAHRLFVDSALDWGQDLPTLHRWLAAERRSGEKLYLAYFGTAWPPYYGVRPDYFLPMMTYLVRPPLTPYELQPGLYCISASALAEVFSAQRGPWTAAEEQDYRELRARAGSSDAGTAGSVSPADYARYDVLRFSRLCKYLQRRTPEANAGYSILIFRLNGEEMRAALEGPVISSYRLKPKRRP